MEKNKLQYQKPKIKVKKVKMSFFHSNIWWLDQFNLVGEVYAQSGGSSFSDGSYSDGGYGDGGYGDSGYGCCCCILHI
jgi:hypothetical protein